MGIKYNKYIFIRDVIIPDFYPSFYYYSYFYDIKLLYTNIIIEINGDFYHANPAYYKHNDSYTYPYLINKYIVQLYGLIPN